MKISTTKMRTLKFAQTCSAQELNLHKYAARIKIFTNMQPESKFAQIRIRNKKRNGNLYKFELFEIFEKF